ncbi:hypothetical protein [Chitinophaga parva]|uniref:hypothetical protein n=1 Tax=Chitinophaga parva TaxID=2169414 RepID=UPI001056FA7D|nr:hypothetical protein [Chitinophaga parva]
MFFALEQITYSSFFPAANVPAADIVVGEPNVNVPGRVQSRINVANGRTRTTPLREPTGNPVSAGWEHVLDQHFDRPVAQSRSVFTIEPGELLDILKRQDVAASPATPISNGQYVRTVNVGENVGTSALKQGGVATSWMQIITDNAGNLITVYPVAPKK